MTSTVGRIGTTRATSSVRFAARATGLTSLALLAASCGADAVAPAAPVASRSAEPSPAAEPSERPSAEPGAPVEAALDASSDAAHDTAASTIERPKDWPEDVAWLPEARLQGDQPASADVELPKRRYAKRAEAFASWLDALRAQGFQVTPVGSSAANLTRGGKKAWTAIENGAEVWGITVGRSLHAPAKLAGACVPVPDPKLEVQVHSMGVSQDGEMLDGSQTWPVDRFPLDVDADGELDWLVPTGVGPSTCPWEVRYEVYVMRGRCGHRYGTVGPWRAPWTACRPTREDSDRSRSRRAGPPGANAPPASRITRPGPRRGPSRRDATESSTSR